MLVAVAQWVKPPLIG